MGFPHQRDRRRLGLAAAECAACIHEHRRHAVGEFAWQVGVPREMHPAKILKRRHRAVDRWIGELLTLPRKTDPILDRPELVPSGFAEFDREADEISWWLALTPVH